MPNHTQRSFSSAQLEQLIHEKKLLRILQPALKQKVAQANVHDLYIVHNESDLYFSLEHIADPQRREQVYRLIQRHQVGEAIDEAAIPVEFQQFFTVGGRGQTAFWTALIIGGGIGMIIGVLAMAIATLFLNMSIVPLGRELFEATGVQITAVIFVLFAAAGWVLTSLIVWYRVAKILPAYGTNSSLM